MQQLQSLSAALTEGIHAKYGLQVQVEEPRHEKSNVSTWKVRITTRPAQQHMPAQRIHLDICAVPSYDIRPMVLRNYYGVEMGTSGLILQVQSREEILADKIVALALRPNPMKNRDLWDIGWLIQQGITLPAELLPLKICDHHCEPERFTDLLNQRMDVLKNNPQTRQDFTKEMRRFLPTRVVKQTIAQEDFWQYLVSTITEQGFIALKAFENTPGQSFSM
ncbi:putative nucleotidyltransferase component of viral defense system [Desulfurispira natronophila]|uniref:Putative nucleotidyltransferase component of viral defense system n=2 Tax=Desulfurispira natronophila TaxID=682562 RepID=A0A7W7Y677_9BACT|nr:putative nucleotidyltransferase component of viral defense system [Desulfurispira natronophila]